MPDPGATITIEGMDELIAKLEKLGKMSALHSGMQNAAKHVYGLMTVYPRKTKANVPKHFVGGRWYKRGTGSYWFTRKGARTDGSSELLDKGWSMKYDKAKFEAVVGNDTSYAKFVQGVKGEQSKAMANIGWKRVDTVAKEETKQITEFIFDAVKRAIATA